MNNTQLIAELRSHSERLYRNQLAWDTRQALLNRCRADQSLSPNERLSTEVEILNAYNRALNKFSN